MLEVFAQAVTDADLGLDRDVVGARVDDEGDEEQAGVEAADEIPDVERSEELRRKVRETRERLRGRESGEPGQER